MQKYKKNKLTFF